MSDMVQDISARIVRIGGSPPPLSKNAKASQAMKELAANYYIENKASNTHRRHADTARKSLYKTMTLYEVTDFDVSVKSEDGVIDLTACIEAPERSTMNARKLWAIMDCDNDLKARELFFSMISVTKDKIENAPGLGKPVAVRCQEMVPGSENVTVKLKD
jgi:hypothetical protein